MALKKYFEQHKKKLFWEGGLSFANFTLVNGAFLVGFALSLGASELMIGILSAIPLFANILQLFSAFILEATGSRKKTSIISLLLGRLLWIPIILIALGILSFSPLLMFSIVLILSSLLIAVGNLSILSWMKDIVPLRKMAGFWGKRNVYASVAGMITYLLGSLALDYFPGQATFGYVFLAALVVGLIGVLVVVRVPEKKRKIKAIKFAKFKENISVPFRDKGFRPILYFGIYWGFALNILAPFYIVFMLQDLSMTFTAISVLLAVDLVGRIIGLNFWGRFMEKWGSRPVLIISVTVNILNPLLFVFIPNHTLMLNYYLIGATWMITAVAYAGLDIAAYRAVFKAAPRKHDAYYLSVFSSLTGLMSAIGPIVGGIIATVLKYMNFLPEFFSNIRALFLIGFVLRVLSLAFAARIDEPRARSVDDVLLRMRAIRFFSFFPSVYNVAYLATRLVLFPTKQLFFIQRKAMNRMQKDVVKTLGLMKKVTSALDNLTAKNMAYYKSRIKTLRMKLSKNVDRLEYQEGTWYEELPAKALERVEKVEEAIQGDAEKIDKQSDKAYGYVNRLSKKLEGAYERNIK